MLHAEDTSYAHEEITFNTYIIHITDRAQLLNVDIYNTAL